MKKIIYKNNYGIKIVLLCFVALGICVIRSFSGFQFVKMPTKDIGDYHSDILTINSIFSGFALTNLGILLSISDDQLVKKLEGSDILLKRNTVIAHSIVFGAISIFISLFFVLDLNFEWLRMCIGYKIWAHIKYYFFNIELLSLCISILYFILSIKKMIELLSFIYVPRPKLSDEIVRSLKERLNRK